MLKTMPHIQSDKIVLLFDPIEKNKSFHRPKFLKIKIFMAFFLEYLNLRY